MTNRNKTIIFFSLVFILFLVFMLLYYYNHTIENFREPKTIYIVWRNQTYGFGDKLRGALALHQYCSETNIRLVVDGTDNICSNFLKNVNSNEYDIIKNQDVIVIENHMNVVTIINDAFIGKDSIFICTNAVPKNYVDPKSPKANDNVLSKENKEFGKFLCEPNDVLQKEVDEQIQNLPNDYGIIHFRFYDEVFSNDITENDQQFMYYFNILKKHYSSTDVLCSNSNNFKKYAKEHLKIHTIDCQSANCQPSHTGGSPNYENIKYSFMEMFIISKSKYIKTKSSYGNVSGFVQWPALIYDIPLTKIE